MFKRANLLRLSKRDQSTQFDHVSKMKEGCYPRQSVEEIYEDDGKRQRRRITWTDYIIKTVKSNSEMDLG